MLTFYDSSGKPYELTSEIGRGGEGTVFNCPDDSALVAKIYHEPVSPEKAEKLRWMAANRSDSLLKISAWIVETLHDQNGRTIGFLMPNVRAKEIHELYSLKSRRVHFPEATWQFLLHTAVNVARAFYVLHKNDHIMGDVNHGNCVVLADGTVKLIDCDSYSIKTDKIRYRCDVGVATHLAPELQGINLSRVERTKEHDNFGLAVIIFQLLFLGRHPFAGNYLGADDKSLEDCIRERRFAYWNETVTRIKQPPGTLSLSQLSPLVADLFKTAFFTEQRPEAREWIEALEDLSRSLNQCSAHIGHHYFNKLAACPWCEIETKTGLLLFPFVSGKEFDNEFNIVTVEKLVESLESAPLLPTQLANSAISLPPNSAAENFYRESRNTFIGLALFELFVIFVFSLAEPGCGFVFGIVVMAATLAFRRIITGENREKFEKAALEARIDWDCLARDWENKRSDEYFVLDLINIRQKVSEYRLLEQEEEQRLDPLTESGYSPSQKVSEEKKLTAELTDRRRRLEKEIERLMVGLRSASGTLRQQQQQMILKAQNLAHHLAQAESNFARVNKTAAMTLVLVTIPICVPIFVSVFQNSGYKSSYNSEPPPRVKVDRIETKSQYNALATPFPLKSEDETSFKVNENVTDVQIAAIPIPEREKSARILHQQAQRLIEAKNFREAELKLRLAVRYADYYVNILYTLSNLLYDQKNYQDSIKFLEKSLRIDSENEFAKLLIGSNYLQIKDYSKGEKVFKSVLERNPESYEANFNLGLIYSNLRKYDYAAPRFAQAVELKPDDAEAYFQLGLALSKIGREDEAQATYETLFYLNENKAEKLRKLIKAKPLQVSDGSPPFVVSNK